MPLVWRAGDAAQVDFFEVTVEVAGERQPVWLFVLHLMYSGRDYGWLYERCNQVAFLDGHVRAFEHLGGVVRRCIYDNLKAAVKRRLGLERWPPGIGVRCCRRTFLPRASTPPVSAGIVLARAYAQYVAWRSGDAALLAQIDAELRTNRRSRAAASGHMPNFCRSRCSSICCSRRLDG